MKQKPAQSFVKERVEIPKIVKDKQGNAILMCPFCSPAHPLRADGATPCGTIVRVQAVQTIYRTKYAKNDVKCVKCGKIGGEMVQWQNSTTFIHAHNCSKNVVTLAEPPQYSKLAKLIYKLPKWAKKPVEKRTGTAMKVDEVLPDGTRTGVILGYAFYRGK